MNRGYAWWTTSLSGEPGYGPAMGVVVIGQVGRDVVLRVPGLPRSGGSVPVTERREMLGGKGANQAVGLAQLGVPVSLVCVVGADPEGAAALRQAAADGIGVDGATRRGTTALLVDVVDEPGSRRLFEQVHVQSLLTVDDLDRARDAVAAADTVSIQLQQPGDTVVAAVRLARQHGARVVVDGAPAADIREELLRSVHVLRADSVEAELLAGRPVHSVDAARELGRALVSSGPELVALAVPDVGDLLVWHGGEHLLPLSDVPVLDPTGAGDAFMAGLIAGLRNRADPVAAGHLAAAAASATVRRLGGRPDLTGLA